MDLFAAVAEELENRPLEIRPLVPTSFATDRNSGFVVEDQEIETTAPATPRFRPSQTEAFDIEEPLPRVPAAVQPFAATSATRAGEAIRQQVGPLSAPEPVQPVTSDSAEVFTPVPLPAAKVIPIPSEPLERLVTIRKELAEPPASVKSSQLGTDEVPNQPVSAQAIHNEFSSQIHSTTIENRNQTIQNFEDLSSTVNAQTNVSATVHQEGPRIVIPARPIELAIHPVAYSTQIVDGSRSRPSEAPREREMESRSSLIDIRIGRIEINAAKPARSPQSPVARPAARGLSLEEVLRKRGAS